MDLERLLHRKGNDAGRGSAQRDNRTQGVEQVKERVRDVRVVALLDTFLQVSASLLYGVVCPGRHAQDRVEG